MQFITFIKSYKLALAEIAKHIHDWSTIYIGEVEFSDNTCINFLFSSTPDMAPGSAGLKLQFAIKEVERFKGGLNNIFDDVYLPKDIKDINDIGKFLYIIGKCVKELSLEYNIEDIDLESFYFDFNKNLVVLNCSINDKQFKVHSNGNITIIGL